MLNAARPAGGEPCQERSPPRSRATLTAEVARMHEEVATHPEGDYHFYTGRRAAEMYGYRPDALDAMPAGAVEAFAGLGCPIERARFQPGERVVDLGSGAGLDALIAARAVGPQGHVVGIEYCRCSARLSWRLRPIPCRVRNQSRRVDGCGRVRRRRARFPWRRTLVHRSCKHGPLAAFRVPPPSMRATCQAFRVPSNAHEAANRRGHDTSRTKLRRGTGESSFTHDPLSTL